MINLKVSITAMFAIILAFITPIIPLLLITFTAIGLDLIFGILKARKLKIKVTSRKASATISKGVLYGSAIFISFCIEKYITNDFVGLITVIPLVLTKLLTCTLLFIETMSINENYQAISGVSIWGKFKDLLKRAKEVKSDVEDVIK